MNILALLRRRFSAALTSLGTGGVPLAEMADMVRPSQDARFGDYQANCAMPLGKRLNRPPREVAADLVARLDLADLCHPPEIAGSGFINVRLKDEWLANALQAARESPRLDVPLADPPGLYVVDYSAPNVAKPMHVGHIRSTVIGDSLYRTLNFLGHRAIGDNHLGDWGTQFGMIIYGFRHFRDDAAYRAAPVEELGRLYRLVNQLVDYHDSRAGLAKLLEQVLRDEAALERQSLTAAETDVQAAKNQAKTLKRLHAALDASRKELDRLQARLSDIEADPVLSRLLEEHPGINAAVLAETARLHAGDPENERLWREFMPPCLEAIEAIYRRLGVRFDHTLGESFYHDRLAGVVADLQAKNISRESEGAICVFLPESQTPMIVQKRDGAFLYATTDLATIQYRMQTWAPDAILYVVDHRQSEHFRQLFGVAQLWGYRNVELQHISFGTVLGEDGRPYKTRSGDTVGLSGLLDEAVARAEQVVQANNPELPAEERRQIAETVGIAALKYADLSQNRTSDYTFSYDKMLAMNGNTATYMQYAYARVRSIFRKGGVDPDQLRAGEAALRIETPAERGLALSILRLSEALDATVADYRPNFLTAYLFELANSYSTFFEQCPVLKADSDVQRQSRLLLCDLTARTLKQGLALLGIDVVEKM